MKFDIGAKLNALLAPYGRSKDDVRLGVAVSGGRDSVMLLHSLVEAGVQVVALNVEHGIRGEASVRDSDFVQALCGRLGVELVRRSVDVPAYARLMGYTLEEAARIKRYEVFERALADGVCDFVALAHHIEDQTETVFLRILRGTGVCGLAGMKEASGRYLRPLLTLSRADIDEYIAANGLEFVEDESNFDLTYSRNFVRSELAALRAKFPQMDVAVMRLSRNAAEAQSFLESRLPKLVVEDGAVRIPNEFCTEAAVTKALVAEAAKLLGVRQDIEERHRELALLLLDGGAGRRIELPHGLTVYREAGGLCVAKTSVEQCEPQAFAEGEFEELKVAVEAVGSAPKDFAQEKAAGRLYVDADKVPDGAVFRRRQDGDRIRKFGGGSKSLGDFLTDLKVPLQKRDKLTVLAVGSDVLAVVGEDISSAVRVSADSKRICMLRRL